MTPVPHERLLRLVDTVMLHDLERYGGAFHIFELIEKRAREEQIQFEWKIVVEYWWSLARMGVVVITGEGGGSHYSGKPHCFVSERGRSFLERGEESPHDPGRYLAAVRKRVTAPDNIVMQNLAEAAAAWERQLFRSSVVMLGVASERLVLMLAEAIAKGTSPEATRLKKMLAKGVQITDVFTDVRDALGILDLPRELGDGLDRKLTAIFEHARAMRNNAGHPTEAAVTADDAIAGLMLFPGLYAFVDAVLARIV